MISWLQDNDTEMYSTHNKESAVAKELLEPYRTKSINI